MILSYFEPNHYSHVISFNEIIFGIELTILILYVIDVLMESFHVSFDIDKTFVEKYLKNKIYIFKLIFIVFLIIDFCYYYSNYETTGLRMARLIRPCNAILLINFIKVYFFYIVRN